MQMLILAWSVTSFNRFLQQYWISFFFLDKHNMFLRQLFCQNSGYGPNVTLPADISRNVLFVALLTTPEELLMALFIVSHGSNEEAKVGLFCSPDYPNYRKMMGGWCRLFCQTALTFSFVLFFFFYLVRENQEDELWLHEDMFWKVFW